MKERNGFFVETWKTEGEIVIGLNINIIGKSIVLFVGLGKYIINLGYSKRSLK